MVDRLNTFMLDLFARLRREEGQGTVEYAMILAVVVVAGVALAGALSGWLTPTITNITKSLTP